MQVLLVATDDDAKVVLKSCATDTYADAHCEHLSCQIAQQLGLTVPLVHTSREVAMLNKCLQAALAALFTPRDTQLPPPIPPSTA